MSATPLMNRSIAGRLAAWSLLPALCCAAAQTSAADGETFPIRLSSRDQAAIGQIACLDRGSPGVAHLNAWTQKKGSRQVKIDVKCEPHGIEESLPVARFSRCSNQAAKWSCEAGYEVLQMTLPNASVVSVVPDGVTPRTAIELMEKAARQTVPPFHGPAIKLLGETCRVRQEPVAAFKGAVNFAISCTHGTLAMTRDCWEKTCRYFITGGG
jgi:hypothetical protein